MQRLERRVAEHAATMRAKYIKEDGKDKPAINRNGYVKANEISIGVQHLIFYMF